MTAAVGVLAGAGFYITAVGATIIAVLIQVGLAGLTKFRPSSVVRRDDQGPT